VILADRAYPLRPYLMKPYNGEWSKLSEAEKLFNVKLARARRCVECAFGQLVAQFQIFKGSLDMENWKIDALIMTCFLLHNILIDMEDRSYRLVSQQVQDEVDKKLL